MTKLLIIAGLGPGDPKMVTPTVQEAISTATDIVGYIPYVARIPPRDGLILHPSDNRVEIERALKEKYISDKVRKITSAAKVVRAEVSIDPSIVRNIGLLSK